MKPFPLAKRCESPRFASAWLTLTALLFWLMPTARADSPAADFSATTNPTGVWSYGYSVTLGSPFILFTTPVSLGGIPGWNHDLGSGDPVVLCNNTSAEINYASLTLEPGELSLHPGPDDEICLLRYTATVSGQHHVSGSFYGGDHGGTTTDVHLLVNGTSVFDGEVSGYGPGSGPGFDQTVLLNAGDTLDFAVGYGANGNYFSDTTVVAAEVTSTPTVDLSVKGDGVAMEGGAQGVVIATRSGDTAQPLTVYYKTHGPAVPGVDYKALSGSVTIPAGAHSAKLKIKPIDGSPNDVIVKAKVLLLPSPNGSYVVGKDKAVIMVAGH